MGCAFVAVAAGAYSCAFGAISRTWSSKPTEARVSPEKARPETREVWFLPVRAAEVLEEVE